MKVETPMVRWHQIINPQSKKDVGANGPILSCSLLTTTADGTHAGAGVLATAGNTEVNLWRVKFTDDDARGRRRNADEKNDGSPSLSSSHILVQPQTSNAPAANADAAVLAEHTRIEHVATLSRGTNERSVNAVKFSPSGKHLVAAGDGGVVVVWSIPPALIASANAATNAAAHVFQETDFPMKILFNQSDDVMDLAWSPDSRRFVVCSLDHTTAVWELSGSGDDGEWRVVHRSAKDHTHYVQGVAYDPKGVYLASMGSDRMVKVYARKSAKESTVKAELAKYEVERRSGLENGDVGADDDREGKGLEDEERDRRAILQNKVLPDLLNNSMFALQNKTKTLKFLNAASTSKAANSIPSGSGADDDKSDKDSSGAPAKRHHMFADELTLGSFFRRLAFTPDGAFLVVPAALWHGMSNDKSATEPAAAAAAPGSPTSVVSKDLERLAESSFATYLFARHHFDSPYKVLTGLEKPSVAVRPNPVLFKLPPITDKTNSRSPPPLPYRSVFAVLTADSVLIYDTHHDRPLAMARGLHYAGLTDAAWSKDGRTLFVTSSDGYVSILSFRAGELGEAYVPPEASIVERREVPGGEAGGVPSGVIGEKVAGPSNQVGESKCVVSSGAAVNTLVPKKKSKTVAATNGMETGSGQDGARRVTFSPVNEIKQIEPRLQQQEQQPAVNTLVPKRKKKIAPTPVAAEEGSGGSSATEKKRPAEEEALAEAQLSTESSQEGASTVNILVAKKKKKVAAS